MNLKNLFACLVLLSHGAAGAEIPEWTANNGQLILRGVPAIPAALVNRLNQYQNVRSAAFLDWTRNGKGIYIRTRFGDISQIHKVHAAGWRQSATDLGAGTHRRGIPARKQPGTRHHHGHWRRRTGSDLSVRSGIGHYPNGDDGKSRNRLVRWSRNGKRIAFQSTQRNGRSNDLWIMDPDKQESAELLLEAPEGTWYGPEDFSKDGQYLLVQQFLTVDDSRIYVLKLKDRTLQFLAGNAELPSANRAIAFDRGSKGFYFITNERGRAAELAWQPLSPALERIYITAKIPWDVTEFALSEDGKRGAFVTNEEGISRLYLLNAKSNAFTLVNNIPVGIISGLKFNPDNRRIAMNLSTAHRPTTFMF